MEVGARYMVGAQRRWAPEMRVVLEAVPGTWWECPEAGAGGGCQVHGWEVHGWGAQWRWVPEMRVVPGTW